MKRKKIVSAKQRDSSVKVTIDIETRPTLTRGESEEMVNNLTDDVMRALANLKYFYAPLSKIKAR